MQNIWNFIVGKLSLQEMVNFDNYPGDFILVIWRPGDTVQNLESPGLSRRVDSTVYIWNVNQLMLLICIRLRGSERRDQSSYKNSKNFLHNS